MKKSKLKIYRQGDVLIERVESVPATATKQKPSARITLALGEATGHHHDLCVTDPADWWKQGEGLNEEKFVVVEKPAEITHQEHSTINVPSGTYRITRQREYSPEAIRNVAD